MPESLMGWTEFGLAGLFGIFALVLTSMYMKFLKTQQELFADFMVAERKSREDTSERLDRRLDTLNQTLTKMNGGK